MHRSILDKNALSYYNLIIDDQYPRRSSLMTFHELIIQSIDSEITQYELEKEQCLKPIYSDKHRRIIKEGQRNC